MIQAIVPHQNSTLRDRRVLINKAYSLSHRSSISTLHWLDSAEQVAVRSSSLSLAQLLIGININHEICHCDSSDADILSPFQSHHFSGLQAHLLNLIG